MNGCERGTIMNWNKSIKSIPPNWGLCDGTKNTPDLRKKYPNKTLIMLLGENHG